MIKENIKYKKGITLVSVTISVIILLILSTIVIYSMKLSNNMSPYNNMLADINLLEDKLLIYFNRYGEIPRTSRNITIGAVTYYEIDLSKLGNVTLNFGKEYGKANALTDIADVYTVNDKLNVYYLKGVTVEDITRHSK